MKLEHESSAAPEANPMDKLLAKLSEQQAVLATQREALKSSEDNIALARTLEYINSSSSSVPITPANESVNASAAPTAPTSIAGEVSSTVPAAEVARLQAELEAAKRKIARMDEELAQTTITKHTIDQAIGGASEADFPLSQDIADRLHQLPTVVRPQVHRDNSWAAPDDCHSETSDALSATGFNRARVAAAWNTGAKPAFPGLQGPMAMTNFQQPSTAVASGQWNRGYGQPFVDAPMGYAPAPTFSNDRMMPEPDMLMPQLPRRNQPGRMYNRSSASSYPYASSSASSFDGFTPSSTPYGSGGMTSGFPSMSGAMNMNMPNAMGMYGGYQPQPIGTPLSPHAPEFTSSAAAWKNEVSPIFFLFFFRMHVLYCANRVSRLLSPKVHPTWHIRSLSTTVVYSTVLSLATGSTLSTRSSVATTSKLLSSSNKSSRLAQLSKSMRLSKPLLPKLIR